MKTELIIALLIMACIGSLATVFILWSKLDEQKKETAKERDNCIAALRLHNTAVNYLEQSEAREQCMADEIRRLGVWNRIAQREKDEMQDKLSAILCPTNNHVWCDGCCVKCGRLKDD